MTAPYTPDHIKAKQHADRLRAQRDAPLQDALEEARHAADAARLAVDYAEGRAALLETLAAETRTRARRAYAQRVIDGEGPAIENADRPEQVARIQGRAQAAREWLQANPVPAAVVAATEAQA